MPASRFTGVLDDGEALAREYQDRLAAEPWAKAHGIVAQAEKGVLGFWGVVDSEAKGSAVETLARTIDGVTRLDNPLVVLPDAPYLEVGIACPCPIPLVK